MDEETVIVRRRSEGEWFEKRRWVPMRLWMWLIHHHLEFAGRHVRWIAKGTHFEDPR